MAQVNYTAQSLENLERLFEFISQRDPASGSKAVIAIHAGIEVLAKHPLIGRSIGDDLRELVISYGSTGYVALYWFLPAQDEVFVLAFRHQRELDYPA